MAGFPVLVVIMPSVSTRGVSAARALPPQVRVVFDEHVLITQPGLPLGEHLLAGRANNSNLRLSRRHLEIKVLKF